MEKGNQTLNQFDETKLSNKPTRQPAIFYLLQENHLKGNQLCGENACGKDDYGKNAYNESTQNGVHHPLISLTFIFKEEALPLLVTVLL